MQIRVLVVMLSTVCLPVNRFNSHVSIKVSVDYCCVIPYTYDFNFVIWKRRTLHDKDIKNS
jgi:hypothetical protein